MLKRAFDVVFSAASLLILAPLLLPAMLLLRLTGEGRVFFIQPRVGQNGRIFGLIKFATMLEDSPNLAGGDITSENDPRVLPTGHFFRKSKINEIPQLLNILAGSMSVVGPRPMTPKNFQYYSHEVQEQLKSLKPGLTGVGSIVFRDEERLIASSPKPTLDFFVEDISPYKGSLEIWYKNHRSLSLDLLLVFLTAWVVLFPRSDMHLRVLKGLPRSSLIEQPRPRHQ